MSCKLLYFAFIVIGITAAVAQTLFIRELSQVFYSNELCLGVILAGWLFFVGLGSIIGRKIKRNIFVGLLSLVSVIMVIEFLLVYCIKPVLNIGAGELISPVSMIIISFFILSPLSIVLGIIFVQGCKLLSQETKDKSQSVNKVYILEAIGYMIGGFCFAYLLGTLFPLTALFILSLLILLSSLSLSSSSFHLGCSFKRFKLCILFLCLLTIWGLCAVKRIEAFVLRVAYPKYEIVNHNRSIHSNLVLVKLGSLYSVYENGILSFSYPLPLEAEEKVHLPLLQVKSPSCVLVLGGTPEMIKELLKYPIQEVHWVRLDKKIAKLIDFSVLHNTRVKMHWIDGRRFVKNYTGDKFDVVIVDVGEPNTALLNRFYTTEFFNEVAQLLSAAGIISIELSSNPNYLSPELVEYNGTIYKTLKQVFPSIILVPGDNLKLFGSRDPGWLSDNPDTLALRLSVPTQYITTHYLQCLFYSERIDYVVGILDNFTPRVLNTDFHPISYYSDIVLKGAYFSQPLKQFFMSFSHIPQWITLLGLILCFILIGFLSRRVEVKRKSRYGGAVFSIGIIGATGIGAQILLILGFEVLFGFMYHKIGIITGAFMLGLAIGAKLTKLTKLNKLSTLFICIILYLLCLFFVINYAEVLRLSEFIFYLLPVIIGFLTGSGWTLANQLLITQGYYNEYQNSNVKTQISKSKTQVKHFPPVWTGQTAGLLYGVDLIGSCVCSFAISVFFIPIYGFNFSFLLLILLNLIALYFTIRP
ncbi:MAG: hypothetical protein HY769_05130 [Candidatus Stahlbacteria bacterium]|nr:hypothetical protein [Candidatus Stahlbacteria bacterium]